MMKRLIRGAVYLFWHRALVLYKDFMIIPFGVNHASYFQVQKAILVFFNQPFHGYAEEHIFRNWAQKG